MTKTKTSCEYEVELKNILNVMKESYKNPVSFALRRSEEVLIKKIEEVQEIYSRNHQSSYKEVIDNALERYNKIIKKAVTLHSDFVSLREFPDEKYFHLNPKERERRKRATLEIAIMDYEDSGKNVATLS